MKSSHIDCRGAGIAGSTVAIALLVVLSCPAGAAADGKQIPGRFGKILEKTQEVSSQLVITDAQEQDIGGEVSQRIRDRYGVVQDAAATKYVTLVGTILAQASSRPGLAWKFIILDTDGVNAFAAPGGYIHVTRGALGLVNNEAELADVLAHEITHVTEKHTLAAIQKGRMIQMGAGKVNLNHGSEVFNKFVDVSTDLVLKGFGRNEELEADQKGIRLANTVGYAPTGLGAFLTRLMDRNKGSDTKQGLFASHPDMKERLDKMARQVSSERLASTATLADRYHKFISFETPPLDAIATVEAGAAGLTGGTAKSGEAKKDDAKKDDPPPPKKKGFGLGSLLAPSSGSEKKSAEVTGSGAARGVDKELGAKGGPVKTIVAVNLTRDDIEAFKKEGGLK